MCVRYQSYSCQVNNFIDINVTVRLQFSKLSNTRQKRIATFVKAGRVKIMHHVIIQSLLQLVKKAKSQPSLKRKRKFQAYILFNFLKSAKLFLNKN
jgi:hypothetical protein